MTDLSNYGLLGKWLIVLEYMLQLNINARQLARVVIDQHYRSKHDDIDNKMYRLVLVLCVYDDYLGVVNAFRVRRKENG